MSSDRSSLGLAARRGTPTPSIAWAARTFALVGLGVPQMLVRPRVLARRFFVRHHDARGVSRKTLARSFYKHGPQFVRSGLLSTFTWPR